MSRNGFRVKLQANDVVELEFYGVITQAPSFFEDDEMFVRPVDTLKFFKDMGKISKLRLLMNSPGGDVYDGFQIANRLDKLREDGNVKSIETVAEGLVASAATLVFLKGDDRVMRNGSRFMIHEPYTIAFGGMNATEMRAAAERMDQTRDEALDLYEKASTLDRADIQKAMESETFYTPKAAQSAGFATSVIEPYAVAACCSASMRDRFRHFPEDLKIQSEVEPTEQEIELRERFKVLTAKAS